MIEISIEAGILPGGPGGVAIKAFACWLNLALQHRDGPAAWTKLRGMRFRFQSFLRFEPYFSNFETNLSYCRMETNLAATGGHNISRDIMNNR